MLELAPSVIEFQEDVIHGLNQDPKTIPCKYFYDERGSQLFDEICDLDEYYLTRTESEIMSESAGDIAEQLGPGAAVIEYGSGSSIKTTFLLDHLASPAAYVPVDISREHLEQTANRLREEYRGLEILPVCADFTRPFQLPQAVRNASVGVIYFPGSTIGNFQPLDALNMLQSMVKLVKPSPAKPRFAKCSLLIGIDLQKDPAVIHSAYNDSDGTTAEFNLNVLHRINRELDGNICVEQFKHRAEYNQELGRVELDLVSQCEQTIAVGDEQFDLSEGEAIRTEHSHKYTIEGFHQLAAQAGMSPRCHWTDPADHFAVMLYDF